MFTVCALVQMNAAAQHREVWMRKTGRCALQSAHRYNLGACHSFRGLITKALIIIKRLAWVGAFINEHAGLLFSLYGKYPAALNRGSQNCLGPDQLGLLTVPFDVVNGFLFFILITIEAQVYSGQNCLYKCRLYTTADNMCLMTSQSNSISSTEPRTLSLGFVLRVYSFRVSCCSN